MSTFESANPKRSNEAHAPACERTLDFNLAVYIAICRAIIRVMNRTIQLRLVKRQMKMAKILRTASIASSMAISTTQYRTTGSHRVGAWTAVRHFSAEATQTARRPASIESNRGPSRPPPSPALPPGIMGRIVGHAAYLDKKSTDGSSPYFNLFKLRSRWYKETNSKVVMVNFAGTKICFVSDPAVYREVFGEKQAYFTNSNAFREIFGYLFPKSMIVLEGEDWQRVRRVSQKAINRMDMDAVIGGVVEVLESAVQHKTFGQNDQDIDTYRFLSRLTFDVFHKVMYSLDPHAITEEPNNPHVKLLDACDGLLHGITGRVFTRNMKFLWGLPTANNRKLQHDKNYILNLGRKIAAERRKALEKEDHASGSATKSLLDGLLLSQQEEIMTDDEVADQVATFFFGAYETTSNTLLFSLNSLADEPQVQAKLREEVKKRFPGGKQDIAKAKLADLDSVKYLVWTVDESFRLNSTADGVPRSVIKDVVVGGYELKEGTNLHIDHRTVSRDPEYFQGQTDLERFYPDRYEKYPLTDKLLSIPFGFGSRICPGRRIAIAEVKTFLALVVSEYEILPPSDPKKKLVLDAKLGLTCVQGTGFLRFRKL